MTAAATLPAVAGNARHCSKQHPKCIELADRIGEETDKVFDAVVLIEAALQLIDRDSAQGRLLSIGVSHLRHLADSITRIELDVKDLAAEDLQ